MMASLLRLSLLLVLLWALASCDGSSAIVDTRGDTPTLDQHEILAPADLASPTDSNGGLDIPDPGSDLASDGQSCPQNSHWEGGACVCDAGSYPADDGSCVRCLNNSHCNGRVCDGGQCRNCEQHQECAPDVCGADGRCAELPDCSTAGETRCKEHKLQQCTDAKWRPSAQCPYGCDGTTGACYPEVNIGWIGGACLSFADCARVNSTASPMCLTADEGWTGGSCAQGCGGSCPDQDDSTDMITFCIDSNGMTNQGGICVSQCNTGLFPDTGCRPGYTCVEKARYGQPGVVKKVCTPYEWKTNSTLRFTYGITAGEVTPTSAIIWSHTGGTADVEVIFGIDPRALDGSKSGSSTSDSGFTSHVTLAGLTPGTRYYYRVVLDGVSMSPIGTFVTAPLAGESVAIRFLVSGDVHACCPDRFKLFDVMTSKRGDFFLSLGDWPYADSVTTLSGYRAAHREARNDYRIEQFLRSTSIIALFDDHEVFNDWDAKYAKNNPTTVANGLQVWREWFPLLPAEPGEYYRILRWGDLEFFILDARTHRDPRNDPDGADANGLPIKTMLGPKQRTWLLDNLNKSNARFKFVLTSVPLDFGTTIRDSWTGYIAERDYILTAIQQSGIGGVIVLAADQHWYATHHYNSGIKEFQTGSISAKLRTPKNPWPDEAVYIEKTYNFGMLDYDPANGGSLLLQAFNNLGSLIYSETIRAGRGQIVVKSNVPAAFQICPRELIGDDCAHMFSGVAPKTFVYAVPGRYQIVWPERFGMLPPADSGIKELLDKQTLELVGNYTSRTDTTVFVDDFSTNRGWVVVDEGTISAPSNWVVESGALVQKSNIYDLLEDQSVIEKLGTIATNGDPGWTDYEVSVEFNNPDNDGLGLIARYQDPDNYYRLSLDSQRSFVRLVKRVAGTFSELSVDLNKGYSANTWYVLRLRVVKSTLTAYLCPRGKTCADDGKLFETSDATFVSGAIGLYSWGSPGLRFDNLKVTLISAQ